MHAATYILPSLAMPGYMRAILSLPHGQVVVKRDGVAGLSVDVAVGDVVADTLVSRIRIIDYKTRRARRAAVEEPGGAFIVYNPPGAISLNARSLIEKQSLENAVYVVRGEEDLLLIPAILGGRGRSYAYGQPRVGVVVSVGSVNTMVSSRSVLKTFKPRILRISGKKD